MYFAHSHISLMHSRAHRALTADQIARVVRRAQAELTGLPVVTTNTMVLVWNDDGSLRRGYQDLQGMTLLAEKMWQLRNMICTWLGPAYGEPPRLSHLVRPSGIVRRVKKGSVIVARTSAPKVQRFNRSSCQRLTQ